MKKGNVELGRGAGERGRQSFLGEVRRELPH
jgi:hypothetical protein